MRCAAACLITAWLAITATLALGGVVECASPVNPISKAISGAMQSANEHPGTGYVRDPRK